MRLEQCARKGKGGGLWHISSKRGLLDAAPSRLAGGVFPAKRARVNSILSLRRLSVRPIALMRALSRPVQVAGFVLGVGGVVLVLGPEVEAAGGPLGLLLGALGALCLSLGWLGQRGLGATGASLPPA